MVKPDAAPVNIHVGGNVDGSIVVGDNNFIVNNNHGTIVYKQAPPQVRARNFVPQPPRAPRGFLNRAAELQKLEAWIASNEMVLIHAPDGMGKSSLIRQAANSQAGRARSNGVILLEGVNRQEDVLGPNDLIQRLFDALFESDPPLKVDLNTARTYLSNTHPLLLLDEVPISPALQNALPDLFPSGAMIFTSDIGTGRQDFLRLPVGPLQRDVAVRLLVNRSGLELHDENKPMSDRLCELLGDVTLAVVIAGNVIRETSASLQDVLNQLEQVAASHPDALDRAFAYAFGALQPAEQNILSIAALTPGVSMSPEWLVTACGLQDAEHYIERLKSLGLLVANSPRLRVPPGIQIPAQRAAVLDQDTVMARLVDYLLAATRLGTQNWDFFTDELGNLFGALTWAVRTGKWNQALQLGFALDPYLTLRGLWDTWREVLSFLLDAARQSGNRAAEAFVLHQTGVHQIGVGAPQQALEFLNQALQLRQSLGDTVGMAYTQHNINFLLGPPPPPRSQPPEPQPPSPILVGGISILAVGAFGLLALAAIIFWVLSRGGGTGSPPPVQPPPITAIAPAATTDVPTETAVPPTETSSPVPPTTTDTVTQPIPVLAVDVLNSAIVDTPFLYQGVDADYFEVPILIRLGNAGVVDTEGFNISVRYEANDGSHSAPFRWDGQSTYADFQREDGLSIGQLLSREARVRIPRIYANQIVKLVVQVDRCGKNMDCKMSNLSYPLPQIIYDFLDNAEFSGWSGYYQRRGEYALEFNRRSPDETDGWVLVGQALKLEDGFQPDYVLFTRPPWVTNAFVQGSFDTSKIQIAQGDQLIVKVGFLSDAGGDGARFTLVCNPVLLQSEPQLVSLREQDLPGISLDDRPDGVLPDATYTFTFDGCSSFSMRVYAGENADADLAVWLSAYIIRAQGVIPPTPTLTAFPF